MRYFKLIESDDNESYWITNDEKTKERMVSCTQFPDFIGNKIETDYIPPEEPLREEELTENEFFAMLI